MAVGYNLSGIGTNTTGILTFIQAVNDQLLFSWGGTLILIGIWVVITWSIITVTNDTNKALITSSFIAFTMALSLRALLLVPNITVYLTLLATFLSIIFTWNRA